MYVLALHFGVEFVSSSRVSDGVVLFVRVHPSLRYIPSFTVVEQMFIAWTVPNGDSHNETFERKKGKKLLFLNDVYYSERSLRIILHAQDKMPCYDNAR